MAGDHLEMAMKSIEAFQNGQLDADKLLEIITVAERDGQIDINEIRVLRNIVARIEPSDITDDVRRVLESLATKINA